MRTKLRTTILFVFIFASSVVVTAQEWFKLSPPGSGFSVLLPAEPKPKQQVLETTVGQVVNHGYSLEFRNVAYAVSYAVFPEETSDPATIESHFKVVRDLAVTKSKATVKSETPITLEGHVGREWIMTFPDGDTIRARSYWVSPRLYIVLAGNKDSRPAAADAADESITKFFNSFSFTKPQ